MSALGPAVFDEFNARYMAAQSVARTFVVPSHLFPTVASGTHTVIVGPRGSGKTTLLRMLQDESVAHWHGAEAEEYRQRIDFTGVFVPADRLWASQLVEPGGQPAVVELERLGISAFTTNVLAAVVGAMTTRARGRPAFRPVELSYELEAEICRLASREWMLPSSAPSFLALAELLHSRLNLLASLVERWREFRSSMGFVSATISAPQPPPAPPDWCYLDFRLASSVVTAAFNARVGENDGRWAFLFDEMELSPATIQETIVSGLRARDPQLLFKLAYSPFERAGGFSRALESAMPDQDFRKITLYYGHHEQDAARFSADLLRAVEGELRIEEASSLGDSPSFSLAPGRILGRSTIDVESRTASSGMYRARSQHARLLTDEYLEDSGFRSYCQRHEVDPRSVSQVDPLQRSATLRKAYPLLVFRRAIRRTFDSKGRRTKRKPVEYCTGYYSLFLQLEGNPRWIKAVLGALLAEDGRRPIPAPAQFDALQRALARFRSLMEILPVELADGPRGGFGSSRPASPAVVVEAIGLHQSSSALGEFTVDPVGSFVVDRNVPVAVVRALEVALNAGAIIPLDDSPVEAVITDLVGRRFRLAYIFATVRGGEFPIRVGRPVQLSSILRAYERDSQGRMFE